MLEIPNLSILYMIQSLIKGLKGGPLQLSLFKKMSLDMIELLSRVKKHINSEETLKFIVGIEVPVDKRESNRIITKEG